MKEALIALLAALLLAASCALAEPLMPANAFWIIPDSDTRYLTEGELWAYSRETLRYIRNEILARHGYAFNTEKFAAYFGSKSWYVPGGYDDSKLSRLEWSNVETVKAVEKEMDALDITNAGFLDIEAIIYNQQNGLCPAW